MPRKPDGQIVKHEDAEREILDTIEKFKPQLARVLAREISPDRLARIAITSLRNNPDLFKCSRSSLFSCIMQCATLNLEPDTLQQHAHLIPYGKECSLVLGYRGLRELVERTGKVAKVEMRAVFEGDDFEFCFGLTPRLDHVPVANPATGKLTHAYAIVTFQSGVQKFDVMTREEIDLVRHGRKGPWQDHYNEMAKKTVLKRCLKDEPMSKELTAAINLDNQIDANKPQTFDQTWADVERAEPIEVTATPVEDPRSDEDKATLEGE